MSRLFSHFPSVNELLESPPLKGVIDRVGRNQVVSETTKFLDRVRQQAQTAAQQAFQFTTQDLAQRVARWITAGGQGGERSIINAAGILLPDDLAGPPLANEAIDAMAHTGAAYRSGDELAATTAVMQKLSGYEAMLVFTTPEAALWAALAAIAAEREVILRRGEIEHDSHEVPLEALARCTGAQLREVGSANRTSLADFEQAITLQSGALLSIALRHGDSGTATRPTLAELGTLASQRKLPLLADLGWGGVLDLAPQGFSQLVNLRSAHEAGVSLALVRGHGTLAGPACGILAGSSELIAQIAAHPFAQASRAAASVVAALNATLSLQTDFATAERSLPFMTLLGTGVENLKLRAERLAPQIAALPAIASAEPVEFSTSLGPRRVAEELLPSWAIAIRPAQGSVAEFAAQLRNGPHPIAARVEESRLLLDLRCVAPKYDLAILEALGLGAKTEEGASADPSTNDS